MHNRRALLKSAGLAALLLYSAGSRVAYGQSRDLPSPEENSSAAFVPSVSAAEPSVRELHRFGVTIGFLSEPFPSLVGIDLSYNLNRFLRLSLGYGALGSQALTLSTYSVQATFIPLRSQISPFIGLGAAYSQFNSTPNSGVISSVSGNGDYLYGALGVEWQSRSGFNLGIGYRAFLPWNGALPGIQVGWYF